MSRALQAMSERMLLPYGWRREKLGNICELLYGSGLPLRSRQEGNVPVYGSNGVVGYHDEPLTKGPTIIIGRKGSVGEVHFSPEPCYPIDTTYYIERTKIDADLIWLTHWLRALNLSDLNKGAAIPGINREDVHALEMPLPPLNEQKRVAAILNEQTATVERARDAAKEQLDLISKYINSVLRSSLDTDSAQQMPLALCAKEVTQGIGSSWKNFYLLGATRAGLAPAKEGVGKNPERYKPVDVGTIFYNPMRILIGSIAMIDEDDSPGITSPDYVVFRTVEGILHPRWFYYWLRSPDGEAFIKTLARGAVRERMLFKRLASAQVEAPSWNVQLQAAEQLKSVANVQRSIKAQLDAINKLPAALLRRAFSGEI